MNKHQAGYNCQFVEKPREVQRECPVCLLVLREPYQVACCGYSFCFVCIEKVKVKRGPCPCCKVSNFHYYPNKGLQRSLYQFKVLCSNRKRGCRWVGELGQLDNHLNSNPTKEKQLQGCQFLTIKCLYCSEQFRRSNIRTHQTDQCPKRLFSCDYCKSFHSTYEAVTSIHWFECGSYPVPCPNMCGKTFKRQNLYRHTTHDCVLTINDCDFKHVGCEVSLPRKDMLRHLEESVVHHLSLHTAQHKQVMANMQRLEQENNCLRQQVAVLTQDLQQLTCDLQMQRICAPICPVRLTVTNFEQKRLNNEWWRCRPFYTHLRGYKMCLIVYANGTDSGKGTHISTCTILMKGEFDDKLTWPFQGKIKIQLLDLVNEKGIFTPTIIYSAKAGDRVTEGEESKTMIGLAKFIPHSYLPQCLKDDCLQFCVSIEQ